MNWTPFSKAGCHYLKDLIALMPRLKKTSYIRGLYKTDIEKIDTAIDTYFQNNSSECQVEIPPLAPSNVHLEFINAIYKSVSLENIFLEMDPTINKLRTTADDINSHVKEIKIRFKSLFYSEIEKQSQEQNEPQKRKHKQNPSLFRLIPHLIITRN